MNVSATGQLELPVMVIGPEPAVDGPRHAVWQDFAVTRGQLEKIIGREGSGYPPHPRSCEDDAERAAWVNDTVTTWDYTCRTGERRFLQLSDHRIAQRVAACAAGQTVTKEDLPRWFGWQGDAVESVLADPVKANAHMLLRRAASLVIGDGFLGSKEIAATYVNLAVPEGTPGRNQVAECLFMLLTDSNVLEPHATMSDHFASHRLQPLRPQ